MNWGEIEAFLQGKKTKIASAVSAANNAYGQKLKTPLMKCGTVTQNMLEDFGIDALVNTINGYALPFVILTLLEAFPKTHEEYLLLLLQAGLLPAVINFADSFIERLKPDFLKKLRFDYQAVNTNAYSFIFILQFVIATYLIIASNDGKDKKPIFSSDAFFWMMTSICFIPALLNLMYEIFNNHHPMNNRYIKWPSEGFKALSWASSIFSLIKEAFPDATDTYPKQQNVYIASLLIGIMSFMINLKWPKAIKQIFNYLSAANTIFYLFKYMDEISKENDTAQEEAAVLMTLWFFLISTTLGVSVCISLGITKICSPNEDPAYEQIKNEKDVDGEIIKIDEENEPADLTTGFTRMANH